MFIKFLIQEKIKEVKGLYFSMESFDKFDNPRHPDYKDYKDRKHEKWHDIGFNNALDEVLRILSK